MIRVVSAARIEALYDRLCAELAASPPAPLEEELVLVDSLGLARRLPLEVAARRGVAARLATPFPARFIWERLLKPSRPDLAEPSPWEAGALAWRLAALLAEEAAAARRADPAMRLLEEDHDGRRRHELARRLAALFDQYLVYRPGLLLAWEGAAAGGLPGSLDPPPPSPQQDWQRRLWRRLAEREATPHRARLLADWLAAAAGPGEPPGVAGLPRRLSLFALHGLPPAHLAVLEAVARHRELTAYLVNPSRDYWGDLPRRSRRRVPPDPSQALLIQANGVELGEWIDQLLEAETVFEEATGGPSQDGGMEADAGPATTLGALQGSLRCLEAPVAALRAARPDDSLQFHACHSLARQAEVVVDRLLDLFAREPGLSPGDVLVLCPDLAAAQPALEAALEDQDEGRRLPWRVWGAPPRGGLARALGQLLALPGGRWEQAAVLAPLACPALRRRRGVAAEELSTLHEWCAEAGISWGWDAAERAALGLPALDEHGWRAGLDRLVLGDAVAGGGPVAGLIPSERAAGAPELLSALLDWLRLARGLAAQTADDRSPAAWFAWMDGWLDRLFDAAAEEEWRELLEIRARLLAAERAAAGAACVAWPVAREALLGILAGDEGIRGGGGEGCLTVAPMLAARGLAAPVIVLFGMDDQVFPRPARRDELDLCLAAPRRGDRRPREQDRGQFLDALGAARRALILTWTGRDPRENTPRPPSVVVGELLDLLGGPEAWVTEHPLHGFSPACYAGPPERRSFHRGHARAATALRRARAHPEGAPAAGPHFLADLDLPEAPRELSLDQFAAFWDNPAKALLRRAGVRLPWDGGAPPAHEPFTLDAAARGRLRRLLLEERRAGKEPAGAEARLRAGGLLPWGRPGAALLREAAGEVEQVLERERQAWGDTQPEPHDVDLELAGVHLRGVLAGAAGRRVVVSTGRAPGVAPLKEWARHLVWCCLEPAGRQETVLIHRGADDKRGPYLVLAAPRDPRALLAALLEGWRAGQRRWLPWLPVASGEIARRLKDEPHPAPELLLDEDWYGQAAFARDDPWLRLVLGDVDPFGHVLLAPRVLETALALGRPCAEASS